MKKSQLQQIIREEITLIKESATNTISEAMTSKAAEFIGYNVGPNRHQEIDLNSPEAVYIKNIADRLYNEGYPISKLDKDKIISAFVDGYVNSIGSNQAAFQYRNNKLSSIIKVLSALAAKGWPKEGQVLGS